MPDLPLVDVRTKLPHARWSIGIRPQTTSITWHWNGPAVHPSRQVGSGVLEQLLIDARWQMRPGWGGTQDGAPGLMYHVVIDRDGHAYQTANLYEQLWHCAHADGNTHGLALHGLIGDGQQPSPAMIATLYKLSDALCALFRIPPTRVYGHLEWRHLTACPGPALMQALTTWRQQAAAPVLTPTLPADVSAMRIRRDLTLPARIRREPSLQAAITGRYKPGTEVWIDRFVSGDLAAGTRSWAQLAHVPNQQAALGYISAGLLEAA